MGLKSFFIKIESEKEIYLHRKYLTLGLPKALPRLSLENSFRWLSSPKFSPFESNYQKALPET